MRSTTLGLLAVVVACSQETPAPPPQPTRPPMQAPDARPAPKPEPEPEPSYFRKTRLVEIPTGASVVHWAADENGTAVALLVRQEDGYRLLVSRHEPIDYRGRIGFQAEHHAFHGIRPEPDLVGTTRRVIGPELDRHAWLAWGPEEIAKDYLKLDPTGKRVAFVVFEGGKWRVVVDGESEEPYDSIRPPVFSADGQRYAYVATRGEKTLVVVDGEPGPEFDGVKKPGPRFSADGTRVAYVALVGKEHAVVVDQKPGARYEHVYAGTLCASDDGRRVLYLASDGGEYFAVVDGEEREKFEKLGRVFAFSRDKRRFAFAGRRGAKWHAVLDGRAGPACDEVDTLTFSPDGSRFAYGARIGKKCVLFLDGERGPAYDGLSTKLAFGPDGRRFAYSAQRGGRRFAVVDGREGSACEGVFGPYCSVAHTCHGEIHGKKLVVFVDGEERWSHEGAKPVSKIVFGPDGERIGYVIYVARKFHTVVDGEVGPAFDGSGEPGFSADGKHVAFSGIRVIGDPKEKQREGFVVLDGEPQTKFDLVPIGPHFTTEGRVAYCGRKGDEWHPVVGSETRVFDQVYHGPSRRFETRDDGSVVYVARKSRDVLRIEHKPG